MASQRLLIKIKEKVNEELLKKADELLSHTDREIIALALSKNDKWAEIYLTLMDVKLRASLERLNRLITKSEKLANSNFWISIALTIVIGLATIFIGIIPLFKLG